MEGVGITTERGDEGFLENVGPQPAEAFLLNVEEEVVYRFGLSEVMGDVPLGEVWKLDRLGVLGLVVLVFERKLAITLITETGVERDCVRLADGEG
jgi:hypothetical protein